MQRVLQMVGNKMSLHHHEWESTWGNGTPTISDEESRTVHRNVITLCPNCKSTVEEGEGFLYEFREDEYLRFCNRECLREWIKEGKDVALEL